MDQHEKPVTTVVGGSSASVAPPAHDLTGKTLGDFYVERLLGQGGMGEVYLARQVSLDRPVALKVLRPEWSGNPTYMARFEAEAWAAAKLNHANIVHIYTLGGLAGLRFIAMEYVQGTNLREYLTKKGVPDLPLALAIMRQSGQAIGAAGEAGLIHRDIKPENLLLTRKGQVKVADFGLARLPEADHLHLTATGMTLGTPMYMSPEQVQSKAVDHRSDLYSLGVTFYHMLAGKPPFHAETAVALALKHVRDQPVSLAVHRPDLPAELVSLVMKLLKKAPEERYQSAGEMLKDLSRIKESLQAANSSIGMVSESPLLAAAVAPTVLEPSPKPARRDREIHWAPGARTFLTVGFLGLIGGGLLGWMARADDVFSLSSPAPRTAPAVWMAPWSDVARQSGPAEQYRYAQLRSGVSDRAAAWLAVPGYHPQQADWCWSAYVQLARFYLRERDSSSLEILSREMREVENQDRSKAREKWLSLSRFIHAASMAVQGEPGEVVAVFGTYSNTAAMDPALAALSLEIVWHASQAPSIKGADQNALTNLRTQLLAPLRIAPALLERIKPDSQ